MENSRFEETVKETENRLFRANKLYHKCLSKVILKFMEGDKAYQNVEEHCKEQKLRVDTIFKELKEFH